MYSYYTELDSEECKKHIDEIVKQNRFHIGAIKGKVDFKKDKFYLVKRNLIYHSLFSRIFYGKFIKKEDGTIIQGSFSIHVFVKILLIIWFSVVIFIGGLIFFGFLSEFVLGISNGEGNVVLGLMITFIILIFGSLLVRFGVRSSKNEEEYVLEFIEKTLDAKEIETHI